MGHVFHLAWYMNGVGFGDSSRTSVPKIMASEPPVGKDRRKNGKILDDWGRKNMFGKEIIKTSSGR